MGPCRGRHLFITRSRTRAIAAMTRHEVTGVSLTFGADRQSVSRTVLAIAAGGDAAPPLPIPFMAYSVAGSGCATTATLTDGNVIP
jgi:hypothetical protein